MDIFDDPDAVKSGVAAINETLLEYVDALAETGVNAVMLDTLFASQSIMSKEMWLEFEGAYVKKTSRTYTQAWNADDGTQLWNGNLFRCANCNYATHCDFISAHSR